MRTWLMLTYKVPRQPSALRVSIWRKLRKLGAVLVHDAVWVLPDTPAAEHNLQWLAAEIREMGAEASVWRSQQVMEGGDGAIIKRFTQASDDAYRLILRDLESARADRAALSRRYQQALATDYFDSALGQRVRRKLVGKPRKTAKRNGARR